MRSIALVLLALAVPASAQDDGRYRTIDYHAGMIYQLATSRATTQTMLLAAGERIQSIILSDPGAYLVSVSGSGDSITLQPNGQSMATMMSVRTDRRSYEVELLLGNDATVPQVVRFSYGTPALAASDATPPPESLAGVSYRLSGNRALRPASISDDGAKTYIAWQDDQAMPAIFALGPTGQEEMVDGHVRGGVFTIDRVYAKIVFRIDRQSATAQRVVDGERTRR